jgi:antitoxin ParD1/3/4
VKTSNFCSYTPDPRTPIVTLEAKGARIVHHFVAQLATNLARWYFSRMRATMNVSLPAALRSWIDEQVTRRGFATASEYIRQVLREERERQARRRIDAALLEGLGSGPASPMTTADWDDIRREGRSRLARRKKAG